MRPGEWHARARDLAAAGVSTGEIAAEFGVGKSAVWKALNPDHVRAYNAGRNEQKRKWDRDHYRGRCETCGAWTSRREYKRCPLHADVAIAAEERREEIVDRWAAGETMLEIAAALGTTKGSLSVDITRMRKAGYDLPYRQAAVAERHAA